MTSSATNLTQRFKGYRRCLGFTQQNECKDWLSAKTIQPGIDEGYLRLLNGHLQEIVGKLNGAVHASLRLDRAQLKQFIAEYRDTAHDSLMKNDLLRRLNNQGRRPEQVYFSWMRGHLMGQYFQPAMAAILAGAGDRIVPIGDDDFTRTETFKRTPKADFALQKGKKVIARIEAQSGFQGINDVKQHKVLEAKRILREEKIPTLVLHFDLYNGQMAFIKLHEIQDDDLHWIKRKNLDEGVVWNIDQNYFYWDMQNPPPTYQHITESYDA